MGGVFAKGDGTLVILLVNDSPAREDEISNMLSDPQNVSYGGSTYSYNAMMAVCTTITQQMLSGNTDILGCGVGWTFDGETTHGFGDSGQEFRVVVSVSPDKLDTYKTAFSEEFGDMIYFDPAEVSYTLDDATTDAVSATEPAAPAKTASQAGANGWILPTAILSAGGALVGLYFLARAVRVRARRKRRG